MATATDRVFRALKALFAPYEPKLSVETDEPGEYAIWHRERAVANPFGLVVLKRRKVTFLLFRTYAVPTMLDGISPALRKRMRPFALFSFDRVEPALFVELGELVKVAFRDRGKRPPVTRGRAAPWNRG